MARTYADIKQQIEQLRAEAERLRAEETAGVVARIREAIATYDLTAQDLGFKIPGGLVKTVRVRRRIDPGEAKFMDGEGHVWGGRGPRPAWLRAALASGRSLADFAVGDPPDHDAANP